MEERISFPYLRLGKDRDPLGHNNPIVYIKDVDAEIQGKKIEDFLLSSTKCIAQMEPPIFLVRNELLEELQKNKIPLEVKGRYPMTRKTREAIRKSLKEKGASAPI